MWWLIAINFALMPILLLGLGLAYFHFFGGPLSHHYLYVSGPESPISPPVTDVSKPSTAASSSMFGPKNNRSPTFNILLHRLRVIVLGKDEQARRMIVFRLFQERLWRLYKLLVRKLTHTGELERMIQESGITMVPLGNCMTERVGFHPHLISLSVRIASYLRSSKQLRDVLLMEASENASEVIAATVARTTGKSEGANEPIETPQEGDEDTPMPTPLSTPSLGAQGLGSDMPAFNLGHSAVHPSPLKTFGGVNVHAGQRTPCMHDQWGQRTVMSSILSPTSSNTSSSSSTSAPPVIQSTATSSISSGLATLPHPPILTLSMSDDRLIHEDKRANHLLQLIVAIKHVSRTSGAAYSALFRPVLYRALVYRNELEEFIRFQLEPVLQISYDQTNEQHEKWLAELWSMYLPLGPTHPTPSARISDDWSQLGFQGDNPATDFRGMGILGLRNLIEFARLCPIQANLIMKHSQEYGIQWFGFAITGINLTADLVQMTKDHTLDAYFYTYGANWNSWHALYASMFIKFDEVWSEAKPANVMSYLPLHTQFLSEFRSDALCFPFSPRSLASDSFQIANITPVTPRTPHRSLSDQDEDVANDDFDIDDVTRVTETLMQRRMSKSQTSSSAGAALSRSTSPFSLSTSQFSPNSTPNSSGNSPSLHPLSRSEILESGGVLPLGNLLDPVVPPSAFARYPLPNWRA